MGQGNGRIEVAPGVVESQSGVFTDLGRQLGATVGQDGAALSGAAGAAGNGVLAHAMGDLSDAFATGDRAAAVSLSKLGAAVAKAGHRYQATESGIGRGMGGG